MVLQPTTPPPFGDKNASAGLLATTILVTVLCIVLVTLRFATRIWIVKRVGWDDWCILFACVRVLYLNFYTVKQSAKYSQLGHPIGTALVVVQLSYGFGRPAYYLTPHQFQEFSKYAYGEWLQVRQTVLLVLGSEMLNLSKDICYAYVHKNFYLSISTACYYH